MQVFGGASTKGQGSFITVAVLTAIGLGMLHGMAPLPSAVLTLGLLSIVLLWRYPIWICYVLVFITPLVSGMPRGALIPYLRPNEPLLLGLFLLVLVRNYVAQQQRTIPHSAIDLIACLYFVGSVFVPMAAFAVRQSKPDVNDLLVYLSPLQYYLYYRIVVETVRSEQDIVRLIRCSLWSGAIVATIAIAEALNVPIVKYVLQTWYPSDHLTRIIEVNRVSRVVSVLGNWHALAGFTVLQIMVGVVWWLRDKQRIGSATLGTGIATSLLAFVPIASLAGVAGLVTFGFLLRASVRGSTKLLCGAAFGLVLAGSLFTPFIAERIAFQFQQTDIGNGLMPRTGADRIEKWREVFWPAIKDNFVFGYGPTIPDDFAWQSQESQYVAVLFKGGVVFLCAHLYFVGAASLWLYKRTQTSSTMARTVALCALMALIILTVMGLSNEYFSYSGVMELVWLLLGLSSITNPVVNRAE